MRGSPRAPPPPPPFCPWGVPLSLALAHGQLPSRRSRSSPVSHPRARTASRVLTSPQARSLARPCTPRVAPFVRSRWYVAKCHTWDSRPADWGKLPHSLTAHLPACPDDVTCVSALTRASDDGAGKWVELLGASFALSFLIVDLRIPRRHIVLVPICHKMSQFSETHCHNGTLDGSCVRMAQSSETLRRKTWLRLSIPVDLERADGAR